LVNDFFVEVQFYRVTSGGWRPEINRVFMLQLLYCSAYARWCSCGRMDMGEKKVRKNKYLLSAALLYVRRWIMGWGLRGYGVCCVEFRNVTRRVYIDVFAT